MAGTLEDYLQGNPLTERIARLMETGDDEENFDSEIEESPQQSNPRKGHLDDNDREHIRRLLVDPGWQVLLQLLDSDIQRLEDAARKRSLENPFGLENGRMWAEAAGLRIARNRIVNRAQSETAKLEAKKKKNGATLGN